MDDYTLYGFVDIAVELSKTLAMMLRRRCGWREARRALEERDSRGWQPPTSWAWPVAIVSGAIVLACVVYMVSMVLRP